MSCQDTNANNNCKNKKSDKKSFPYPDCWKDEERMKVLLAPFRIRSVNPLNYDSKMKFWQDLIEAYCQYKGSASFCKQDLQVVFARGSRTPAGLDTVLEDMVRVKKIRTLRDYEYDPEDSWTGWAINRFVKKPLAWGVYKLKNVIGAPDEGELGLVEYIHIAVIKKFCRDLLEKVLQQHQGKLLHYEILKEMVTELMQLTDECLQLCLHTLHCRRKIGLEYKQLDKERLIHLIKIPSKTDNNIAITEIDHAMHNLQMTQKSLQKQIEELEEEIKSNEEKARQHIRENKRQLAKTYLRKKQLLEKNYEKRSIALHNIETLLSSVDEAQSNGEILDAYKFGSKALQNALNESGLKYDNVDEVISEVRGVIETHKELQDTLANANLADTSLGTSDNDELEKELKEILGEYESKNSAREPPIASTAQSTRIKDANANKVEAPKQKITIHDQDLLAMLENLEVEDNSPTKSNSSQNSLIK